MTGAVAVRKKLETIIQEQGVVHADLRLPKTSRLIKVDEQRRMTISEGEPVLSLIDFDYAGMVGEVRYPPFRDPRFLWPTEAKSFGVLEFPSIISGTRLFSWQNPLSLAPMTNVLP